MSIIEQMLQKYNPQSQNELINALKEIFQEFTLLGLYRGEFFKEAVLYGGTSLRILYGLKRFSEDLDFSLLQKNPEFDIEKYFPYIEGEFEALGISVSLTKKIKRGSGNIDSAFLKNDTAIYTLAIESKGIESIHSEVKLKIKIEVDTNPPLTFQSESKTLLLPIIFNVRTMTLPNLYVGKMHALLFRSWKNRVKGRDWFDFEWYVKKCIKLNLKYLGQRMVESGDLSEHPLTKEKFQELLNTKIDSLNIEQAINEVRPFIKDQRVFDFWSKEYFKLLASKIEYVD